jgi:hypothetical protein
MRPLKTRVHRLEQQWEQDKKQQPSVVETADGRVSARVSHHKCGTTATVTYDSLSIEQDDAINLILPQLPPNCVLFVTPRMLSPEEWTKKYTPAIQSESTTLH